MLKPCVSVGDKISIIPRRGVPYEMHGHVYMLLENADVAGIVDDDVVKELERGHKAELPHIPPALFGAQ